MRVNETHDTTTHIHFVPNKQRKYKEREKDSIRSRQEIKLEKTKQEKNWKEQREMCITEST